MRLVLVCLLACRPTGDDSGVAVDTSDTDTDTDADTDTDTDTDADTDTDTDTDADAREDVEALTGDITWAVDFDAAAEASGHADCAYTRHYEAVEDQSAPWLCPDCDVVFRAQITLTAGLDDCYRKISGSDPSPVEWVGWTGGTFRRANRDNFFLTEQGTAAVDAATLTTHNDVPSSTAPDGAQFGFAIDGAFTRGTTLADPLAGYRAPAFYACGWPKGAQPPYTGDFGVAVGGTLPDAVLHDVCDEPVRLYDFAGKYLIIDVAAVDCGPCRAMAGDAPAFFAQMDAEGIEVEAITLLAPSLNDTLSTPGTAVLQQWIDDFGVEGPVLADRGFGLWSVGQIAGEDFGYPTTLVVSPELEVLSYRVGYSSQTKWEPFAEVIRAHRAGP